MFVPFFLDSAAGGVIMDPHSPKRTKKSHTSRDRETTQSIPRRQSGIRFVAIALAVGSMILIAACVGLLLGRSRSGTDEAKPAVELAAAPVADAGNVLPNGNGPVVHPDPVNAPDARPQPAAIKQRDASEAAPKLRENLAQWTLADYREAVARNDARFVTAVQRLPERQNDPDAASIITQLVALVATMPDDLSSQLANSRQRLPSSSSADRSTLGGTRRVIGSVVTPRGTPLFDSSGRLNSPRDFDPRRFNSSADYRDVERRAAQQQLDSLGGRRRF